MNEIKVPIPSRIYNSAQGGHVCGPEDIDYGSKVVHLVPEKTFEEQVDVNEGGTENTVYVIHDDFTLAADVAIPSGCTLRFDGGSLNSPTYKITANNTFLDGKIRILCDFIGKFTNPRLNIDWFGAIRSRDASVTGVDNTTVLQRVLTNCALNGNIMYIPTGVYIFSDTISTTGIQYEGGVPMRQLPSIKGESPLRDFAIAHYSYTPCSMLVYNGAANKPAIFIDGGNGADGGTLENFSIYRNVARPASDDGTVGLKMYHCINYRMYNVSIQGFGTGFVNDSGWSWRAFGLTCTQNFVGVSLGTNSNAASLIGCQLHQNHIGVYITGGLNIQISGCTLEGQEVGICADHSVYPNDIIGALSITNCYFEQNPIRDIVIGASVSKEDYTIVDNANAISNTTLSSCNTVSSNQPIPLYFGCVNGVHILAYSFGGDTPLYEASDLASNVYLQNQLLYRNNPMSRSKFLSYKDRNLIRNGFNEYSYKPFFDNATFEVINGVRYMKITLTQGNHMGVTKKMYPDEFEDGVIYLLGARGYTTGGSASLVLYKPNFGPVSGGSAGSFDTKKKTIGSRINGTNIRAEEFVYVAIYVTNDTEETQYLYIESLTLAHYNNREFRSTEQINNFSGSVNATSTGVDVTIPFADGYNVIATNTGAADAQIRVVKGDKKITIYASAETTVDYSIVRL